MNRILTAAALSLTVFAAPALADDMMSPMVEAMDQDVSNGVVSASKVMAPSNGWMVVHRTDAEMKPGPVVGYAPLRMGETDDVAVGRHSSGGQGRRGCTQPRCARPCSCCVVVGPFLVAASSPPPWRAVSPPSEGT